MDPLFQNAAPGAGLAPNLVPTPPLEMPEPPGPASGASGASPFVEPLSAEEISKLLVLDRPLTLFIPDRDKYPEYDFRIINSTATEMAAAMRKGWRPVDAPELKALFEDKVSGTDKDGKITRPVLVARPKAITEMIVKRNRRLLAEQYAGLNPRNNRLSEKSKYVETGSTIASGDTNGKFDGAFWRIRGY